MGNDLHLRLKDGWNTFIVNQALGKQSTRWFEAYFETRLNVCQEQAYVGGSGALRPYGLYSGPGELGSDKESDVMLWFPPHASYELMTKICSMPRPTPPIGPLN